MRGWLARTAVRHLESRTQGEQNQRPDLTNLTFCWLKDSTVKVWLRRLCNMWRLWLYKLSEVTGRRRRRAGAEFEKARRSLVLMQCDLKMMHFFVFLCVFLAMHKFLSWDECGLCMAIDSPWSFTMLQAVQSSSKDTSASHSRLMHEQQRSSRQLHFVESFSFEDTSLQTPFPLCNLGWNRWNLPSQVYLVWWPEILSYKSNNDPLFLFWNLYFVCNFLVTHVFFLI